MNDVIDNRSDLPEANKDRQHLSWSSASEEIKKGLPPPPERKNFDSDESFLEAGSGWWKYVMPVLSRRYELTRPPQS